MQYAPSVPMSHVTIASLPKAVMAFSNFIKAQNIHGRSSGDRVELYHSGWGGRRAAEGALSVSELAAAAAPAAAAAQEASLTLMSVKFWKHNL